MANAEVGFKVICFCGPGVLFKSNNPILQSAKFLPINVSGNFYDSLP